MPIITSESSTSKSCSSLSKSYNGLIVFIVAAVVLAGCGDPDRAKLIGTWQIKAADDVADRIDASDDESSPPRMSIEFANSGTFKTTTVMGNIDRTKEGSWIWVSYDESKQTAVVKCTVGLQETDHDISWIDESVIELIPPNLAGLDMRLRFVRSK